MKKFYLLFILTFSIFLVACNSDEDTKVNDNEKATENEADSENSSTGNSTLDFMNENASDYDEVLEEAINSNRFSKDFIDKKAKETAEVIIQLYGGDKSLTNADAITKYLKEHSLLSDESIKNEYVPAFLKMNVDGEKSEIKYIIDKAEQISVDGIEIQFKADVVFYDAATNKKIDTFTGYHTVIIGQDENDKDKFTIIKLVISD